MIQRLHNGLVEGVVQDSQIVQIEHGENVRLDVERTKTITNESEREEQPVILHKPSAHW